MGMGVRRGPRGTVGSGRNRTLLEQRFPVSHQRMSLGVTPGGDGVEFALNMIPVQGALRQRPPFQRVGSAGGPTSSAFCQGQLFKADGTVVTWALDGGASTIYTFNWTTATWTAAVSSANLSSASISLVAAPARVYWCTFNNTVVFNDGTNQPWTWDGTSGAGGLTKLTNAPTSCYGRPTVYYAKLFFIKGGDRRTIVWSEENTANTGYEAGGYSNVWVLGQTTSQSLTAIHGTNDGLYYFRASSIGVIRGAVSTDFTTSGVHDSVSAELGVVAPEGVAVGGNREIWFANQHGQPCVLPAGGAVVRVPDYGLADQNIKGISDGFGYNDFSASLATTTVLADIRTVYMRESLVWPFPTVWVAFTTTAGSPGIALVVNAETAKAVCVVQPFGAVSMIALENLFDSYYSQWLPCYLGSGFMFACGHQAQSSGSDQNISGSVVATTCRCITTPMGGQGPLEFQFDVAHLVVGGLRDAQLSGTVQVLTSRRPNAAVASSAQAWATTLLTSSYDSHQHVRVGLNQAGRWARVMVALSATQLAGYSLHDIRLEAIPVAIGADTP